MLKRVLLIYLTCITIVIIQSCCGIIQDCCECTQPIEPFFDYNNLDVTYSKTIQPNQVFTIDIKPDSVFWLSNKPKNTASSMFVSSALACSCNGNGEIEKFKISEINIIPDSIFSELIPLNASITDLFEISTFQYSSRTTEEFVPLNEMSDYRRFFNYPGLTNGILIRTKSIPIDKNRNYNFIIQIVRENQTIIEGDISGVAWN